MKTKHIHHSSGELLSLCDEEDQCSWEGLGFGDSSLQRSIADGMHDRLHDKLHPRYLERRDSIMAVVGQAIVDKNVATGRGSKASKLVRAETCRKLVRDVIDLTGPLGIRREVILKHSQAGGFTEKETDEALRDLADDEDIYFKSALAEPDLADVRWKAKDTHLYQEAISREDDSAEGKAIKARRQAEKVSRKATREAAKNVRAEAPTRATRAAKAPRQPSATDGGSWTVERTQAGSKALVLIGTFPDKKPARAAARKAVMTGLTVTIKDGSGTVTNTYAG